MHHIGHALGHQDGAHRQPTGERLGGRQDVGRHTVGLVRPERAGTPHAALDLVEDQQRVVAIAQLAQPLQELGRGRIDAAFALHRLDDHRAHVVAHHLRRALEIVERRDADSRHQRPEGRLVFLARGGGQCAEGAAVKRAAERHERGFVRAEMIVRPFARKLERALVGLGAGICEEDAIREAGVAKLLGETSLRRGVE